METKRSGAYSVWPRRGRRDSRAWPGRRSRDRHARATIMRCRTSGDARRTQSCREWSSVSGKPASIRPEQRSTSGSRASGRSRCSVRTEVSEAALCNATAPIALSSRSGPGRRTSLRSRRPLNTARPSPRLWLPGSSARPTKRLRCPYCSSSRNPRGYEPPVRARSSRRSGVGAASRALTDSAVLGGGEAVGGPERAAEVGRAGEAPAGGDSAHGRMPLRGVQ